MISTLFSRSGSKWCHRAAAAVLLWAAGGVPAMADSVYRLFCGYRQADATMLTAEGFTGGEIEVFTFAGECALIEFQVPGAGASADELRKHMELTSADAVYASGPGEPLKALTPKIFVHGEARWRRSDQTAIESLTFSGAVTGTSQVRWTSCYTNPFMLSAYYCEAAAGQVIDIQLIMDAPADVIDRHTDRIVATLSDSYAPLFYRKFDRETAEALTAWGQPACPIPPEVLECVGQFGAPATTPQSETQTPSGAGTVPLPLARPTAIAPVPMPQTLAPPANAPTLLQTLSQFPISLEAEALLNAGVVLVRGGEAVVQDMEVFGPEWSGSQQLFWGGGVVGGSIALPVDVQQSGSYLVTVELTQAPDYGDLAFEVDGVQSAAAFSGFAPNVAHTIFELGIFELGAGSHQLRVIIAGKNEASSNYIAGVDRIMLTPVN
jgi:hypothetical protein